MKKTHARLPILHGEGKKRHSLKERHRIKIRAVLMRINLITIITLVSFLQVAGMARGQQVSLELKNVPLPEAFKAIERQTSFVFFFPSRLMKDRKPVNAEFRNADFRFVMDKLLEGQGLAYTISENYVIIKEAVRETGTPARQLIQGRVTDMDGKPIGGATIKVKDAELGTVTDSDGRFKIDVPDEEAVLIISYVGYLTIQKSVNGGGSILNVRLVASTAQLKEVTVMPINTGYETIKPERFVGSATVLDSAIIQRGVGSSLIERLDGITNGLQFVRSGGSTNLLVRGFSTIGSNLDFENNNNTSNPLIILDDFPYYGNLNNINPNDIESVTVLKDAAATSIWGARAGNGVIVITSKKGKSNGGLSIVYSSNVQISEKQDLSNYKRMNSSDFIDVEEFLFEKGFYASALTNPYRVVNSPVVELLNKVKNGEVSEADANAQIAEYRHRHVNDEYKRYVQRNAVNVQNYVGLSGGGNKMFYNISLGADNNKTPIKGNGKNERYSVSSDMTLRPNKTVDFTTGINYVSEYTVFDAISTAISPGGTRLDLYPYAKFSDDRDNNLAIPYKYRLSYVDTAGGGRLLDWHFRPLDEMRNSGRSVRRNSVRMNTGIRVRPISWLTIDLKYQYLVQNQKSRNFNSKNSFFTRDLINSYTAPRTFERSIPEGGILDLVNSEVMSHNFRGQASINKSFGEHNISSIIAIEASKASLGSDANRLYGYDEEIVSVNPLLDYNNTYPFYNGGRRRIPNITSINERNEKFSSQLINVNYSYDSKYALYASARRDGSNLLGVNTNNRWKPLWSAGGRWTISNEEFYGISWLSNLSIKGSYGYAGNVSNTIPSVATILYVGPNLWNQNFATVISPPNPDLRWEEVRTLNLGVDFSLLRGRINTTIEVFRKKTKDIVVNTPIDPTIGLPTGSIPKNAGMLSGKGVDISIQSNNLNGAFSWNTMLNYSFARSWITEYYYDPINTPNYAVIKKNDVVQALYAYKWAGLDPENGDPVGYLKGGISKKYDEIFLDSIENQAYIGSSIPLHFGNMLNTFRFKGVEFSVNLSYKAGYYFRRPSIDYSTLFGSWKMHTDYTKRWKGKGDELVTNIPSMTYPADQNRDRFYTYSEINYFKGDHIRLQDMRLSYDLSGLLNSSLIKQFHINAYAGNLNVLLWSGSKTGYDPDYPVESLLPPGVFSLGIKVVL